jgi:hypothetical protein
MIKFFRHIRKNLLIENKTGTSSEASAKAGKYLKYAIGEIALVMIGILLALQVNNWNEKRKLKNSVESLLLTFENELTHNIGVSDGLIRLASFKDSILRKYYNNKITRQEIKSLPGLFFSFPTSMRQYNDDNLNKLIALEEDLPKDYLNFFPQLKELKRRINSQRHWEQKGVDLSWERQKENVDELPWYFLRDSISRNKAVDYVLSDSIYKNKLRHYYTLDLRENVWDASLIKTSSVALLWEISKLRGTSDPSIETFLDKLNLVPFQELTCDGFPYKETENAIGRLNFIFYNNTDNTIEYLVVDLDGKHLTNRLRSISPKSFYLEEERLRKNELIEISVNGTCKRIYRRDKEDYIVVN